MMKTLHHNGEYWYENSQSLVKRARRWLIWIGGWEKANGAGWDLSTPSRRHFMPPFPVSVLGHRTTFFGNWMQIRLPHTYLTIRFKRGYSGGPYAYLSNDGTPGGAHCWLFGAPHEVRRAVHKRI